jgi:hypothetical protein
MDIVLERCCDKEDWYQDCRLGREEKKGLRSWRKMFNLRIKRRPSLSERKKNK